ncbi:hypothetical protein B0H13DRAFT_2508636 [Mycena leptocephala]|nr:hypothetical protein B0H13DRAFT_2508636 [Mycena leptocephala]
MPVTLSTPLSLYSIPVVWLTAFLPCTMKACPEMHPSPSLGADQTQTVLIQQTQGYNKPPPAVAARILRMDGAHYNGYENLPIWIAAVLVGHIARLDNYTLNVVSLLYIGGRITYNYIYFNQATELQSLVRSAVYFSTLSLPMYLIFKAAAKIAAAEA